LPVAAPSAGGSEPPKRGSESPPSGRRRILVVDDNEDSADSLGQLLELLGHEVRTAYDGEAGVAEAEGFRPDMVLMDIGMPRLNGYDAARRIREQPWGKGVVLIALTGWGQEGDRQRSQEAGFDAHLVKPVDPAALKKILADSHSSAG
jgi:CheY-like chemotaxis protein